MPTRAKSDLYERELARYRQLIESDPGMALQTYGMTLVNSLDPAERTMALRAFGIEAASAEDLYNLGVREARRENYTQAIDYFRQAVEANPDLLDAIHNLAICYEKTGHVPAAKDTWEVYLDIVGNTDEAARVREHVKSL